MTYILAVAGAITTATRLGNTLENSGCSGVKVVHTPSSISTGGCSYSVKLNESCMSSLNQLINQGRFKIKKLYKEVNSGKESVYIDISR